MAGSGASSAAAPPRATPAPQAVAAAAAALRGRPSAVLEAAPAAAPPQAPPPPAARTAAAAAALRGLLKRVADAALLGFCGAMWANHAANGVAVAARWACGGDDSRAAAVAKKAADAAFVAAVVLVPVAAPRFFWIMERWPKPAGDRQSGSGGVTSRADVQPGRPASSGAGARPCQNAGPASVTFALLLVFFCVPVMLVGLLIQAHAPGMGSYQQKFGNAISNMAVLIATLVLCAFLIPGMIIQLRRHGM